MTSLLNLMNETRRWNVITIEEPIEVFFQSHACHISQREIPTHSKSFAAGIREALREDPDVIVVGEMKDRETVRNAIVAADAGHLVFGAMNTKSAARTVLRIVDMFPPHEQGNVRRLLADVLRGVLCQQLVPGADGKKRHPAVEVMAVNSEIARLIREDRAGEIPGAMKKGAAEGMRLMDDSLLELVRAKKVSVEDAVARAADRERFANVK
jgi:twitching motility protein PilT